MKVLTGEQCVQYETEGFLCLPGFLPFEWLQRPGKAMDKFIEHLKASAFRALAAAAALCNKHDTSPRGLLNEYFDKQRASVNALTGCDHDLVAHPPARKFTAMPG